jgi:tRNA A-37 threonylcarbamoyl transferase component Bud32
VIWRTKQKFVMRITAPSGKVAAFKFYDKLKSPQKFFLRYSPAAAEALNYQRIADMDIAAPQLLAAGDVRKRGKLKNSFIITAFAENYRDGRDFFGEGIHAGDITLRNEFIRRAMELLARCHDHHILHRGYTPSNILSRVRASADANGNNLDIMFIDVASCRKLPRWLLKLKLMVDFIMFFRFFELDAAQRKEFLQYYLNASEKPLYDLDTLSAKVEKALRKHLKKK